MLKESAKRVSPMPMKKKPSTIKPSDSFRYDKRKDRQLFDKPMMMDPSIAPDLLTTFSSLPPLERREMLVSILRQCDPSDMTYLYSILPDLHRDFIVNCPQNTVYTVIGYLNPTDIATMAQVSRKWLALLSTDPQLWTSLYKRIGLEAMSPVFYSPSSSVKVNAKRLFLMNQWARGVFSFKSFRAHVVGITALSFNGSLIATGSADKTCRVFSVKNGRLLRTFHGHQGPIACIQMDTSHVVTGSTDKTVKVWSNIEEGKHLYTLEGHLDTVSCLKYSDSLLVTGSEDKTLRVWSWGRVDESPFAILCGLGLVEEKSKGKKSGIDQPLCMRVLHGHKGGVKCLDFQLPLIFSGDVIGSVRVWHLHSGNCLGVLSWEGELYNLTCTPQADGDDEDDQILDLKDVQSPISSIKSEDNMLLISNLAGTVLLYKQSQDPPAETIQGNSMALGEDGGAGMIATSNRKYATLQSWIVQPNLFTLVRKFEFLEAWNAPLSENSVPTSKFSMAAKKKSSMMSIFGSKALLEPEAKLKIKRPWCLCSKLDKWRVITSGSEGRCVVWNHTSGKRIYTLKGNTIDIGHSFTDPGTIESKQNKSGHQGPIQVMDEWDETDSFHSIDESFDELEEEPPQPKPLRPRTATNLSRTNLSGSKPSKLGLGGSGPISNKKSKSNLRGPESPSSPRLNSNDSFDFKGLSRFGSKSALARSVLSSQDLKPESEPRLHSPLDSEPIQNPKVERATSASLLRTASLSKSRLNVSSKEDTPQKLDRAVSATLWRSRDSLGNLSQLPNTTDQVIKLKSIENLTSSNSILDLDEMESDSSEDSPRPQSAPVAFHDSVTMEELLRKKREADTDRAVTAIAFDDQYIVLACMDGTIRVWEASQ